ncbi:MAG: hypothetical protein ACOX6Q_03230 [Candidatus Dojkabacteria bacterium]|jgi:hypothetical protein
MKIAAQQYILNRKNSNSFVVVYKSLFENRKDKSGKDSDIYILFRISSHKRIPLARLAKFVIEAIVDGYIYSISKTTNDSLKESLNQGLEKMKSLIKHDKDLEETGIDMSFTVVLVRKEGLYVGRMGEDEIFLCKKDKCVNVTEIMEKKKANTAGLVLEEKESLIVSTSKVLSPVIAKVSILSQKDSFKSALAQVAKSLPDGGGLLCLTSVEEEQNQTVEKVVKKKSVEKKKSKLNFNLNLKLPSNLKEKVVTLREKIKLPQIPENLKENMSDVWLKVKNLFDKAFSFVKKYLIAVKEKIFTQFQNKKWFKKIGSQLSTVKLNTRKVRAPLGSVRIDDYKIKELRGKRFKILFLVLLIVGLAIFGVNFTKKIKYERAVAKDAREKFAKITEFLEKAESMIVTDRSGAETNVFRVENLIKEVPTDLSEKDMKTFDDLKKKYLQVSDTLFKKIGVSAESGNLEEYIQARLSFGEGADLTDVDIYHAKDKKEYLLVSDKGRKAIYSVDLADKTIKTLTDDKGLVKEPKFVSVGVEGVYIYDEKSGLLKAPFDEANLFGNIVSMSGLSRSDIKYQDISGLIMLTDADNAYFLTKDIGAILKSSAAYSNRYSLLFPYIENEGFKEAVDILGDLSVYVVSTSQIYRYSWNYVEQKQAENPLSPLGFNGDYGNLVCGYTYGEDMKSSLFLFDSNEKRLFRFEKPLEGGAEVRHPNQLLLLNQYQYRGENQDGWSDVKDLVVDLAEKNAYIIENSVIWRVSL